MGSICSKVQLFLPTFFIGARAILEIIMLASQTVGRIIKMLPKSRENEKASSDPKKIKIIKNMSTALITAILKRIKRLRSFLSIIFLPKAISNSSYSINRNTRFSKINFFPKIKNI